MPKNRHFGAGSDTMQQVHGAGVKSNGFFRKKNLQTQKSCQKADCFL